MNCLEDELFEVKMQIQYANEQDCRQAIVMGPLYKETLDTLIKQGYIIEKNEDDYTVKW